MPDRKPILWKQLLYPLAWSITVLYGLGVRLRLWLYRVHLLPTRRLPIKVISVGNLVVGGTGKTPHTALLALFIQKKGLKTAVVSRGYRGTAMKKGAVISDGHALLGTVEEGGEEPYWLAQRLAGIPVVVGRDRYRSGMQCVHQWQSEWIVLDDGFQHIQLEREIDILLLAGHRPFGEGNLLPLGTLREPIQEMNRADIIVITHAERLEPAVRIDLASRIRSRTPLIPIFFSQHRPALLWTFPGKEVLPLSWMKGKRILAFCGLAEPESLSFSLNQLGAEPIKLVKYPDHHFYQDNDKRYLEILSRSLGIDILVTTEKDALKLGTWEAKGLQILVLGIEVEILDSAFWTLLDQKVGQKEKGERQKG